MFTDDYLINMQYGSIMLHHSRIYSATCRQIVGYTGLTSHKLGTMDRGHRRLSHPIELLTIGQCFC